MLVENPFAYTLILILLIAVAERRATKRGKILASLLLTFLVTLVAKNYFNVHRPCFGEDYCPLDYSFPSLHAAIAFALMCGFLNKRIYPLFLLFAVFIVFSRINFGVHTFYDVAASLPIALICYYLVDRFYGKTSDEVADEKPIKIKKEEKNKSKTPGARNEILRKVFHMVLGVVLIVMINHFGRGFVIGGLFFGLLIGTLMINQRMLGKKIKWIMYLEEKFERPDVPIPGWGFACYLLGVLLILSYLNELNEISAGIFILAFGDGVSGLVGRHGKIRYPHNKRKTFEGSIAFFLASLPAAYFIGWTIIPLALLVTIFETIPEIEDNITITVVSTLFFLLT